MKPRRLDEYALVIEYGISLSLVGQFNLVGQFLPSPTRSVRLNAGGDAQCLVMLATMFCSSR